MSDYVFEIGEDNFPKFNREYVSMNTSEGRRITIALVVSGIPFSGQSIITAVWVSLCKSIPT